MPVIQLDSAGGVCHYKSLANVERAFRSLKTIDLKLRPIHHHLENRVRAHLFLCMLAFLPRGICARRRLHHETPTHFSATLLAELSSIVRNTGRPPGQGDDAPALDLLTPHQRDTAADTGPAAF